MEPCEGWAGENFSEVLLIDEVYDHCCCVTTTTDALNDVPVAYVIADRADKCVQDDVEKLLRKLKEILPGAQEVVITDGSPLYKTLIKNTWSKADHHLCYFHALKDICMGDSRACEG